MSTKAKEGPRTNTELLGEIEQLRSRLDEAEQTLDAIRSGEVDALVVTGPHGDQIFSLAGSERTYRIIVETMYEAALTIALDGRIQFCNQRFCDLVKAHMGNTIGKKAASFIGPAQQSTLQTILTDVQSGPVKRRLTLRASDGAEISVLVAASLLVDGAQTNVCMVASDLTTLEAQANFIQVLREQQQALEKSKAELDAANTSLRDSRRAALNVAEDAVIARRQAEETSLELRREVSERKRVEEALKKLNEHLENRVAERTAELAAKIKDLEVETAERLRASEALRENEQMLIQQSRQAAMGEMIGNIAHQWRQPLNVLGMVTQRLKIFYEMGKFSTDFLEQSVDQALELIRHMSRTIDDFRDFFKPEKEKVDFPVSAAITTTLSLLEGSLQNPRINIRIEENEDPVLAYGYPNEFAQVLLNILTNARDVIVERKIADPRVTFTTSIENGCVVVTVSDNAGGISDEILDRIFDPYFTTKGKQKGTGIGLFMSKSIIEKNMGGRLTVRNSADGAEFRIELCNENED